MKRWEQVMVLSFCVLLLMGCTDSDSQSVVKEENKGLKQSIAQLEKELQMKETVIQDLNQKNHRLTQQLEGLEEKNRPFHVFEEQLLVTQKRLNPEDITINQVKALLGEPKKTEQYIGAHGGFEHVVLTYDEASFTFVKDEKPANTKRCTIKGGLFTTERGISVGSTKDEVIASYGEDFLFDQNQQKIYYGEKTGIAFQFQDDFVTEIVVWFYYE